MTGIMGGELEIPRASWCDNAILEEVVWDFEMIRSNLWGVLVSLWICGPIKVDILGMHTQLGRLFSNGTLEGPWPSILHWS